ncbi:hypothetical protein KOSB73_260348 [Klebsiella grimontii]|uniref:Uncharacterized protein n=1 Tax=Klebsiella grimontii TaxID=2058152 RepID=A0A285B3U1_9ENTR|nr:hypothetical protein KOSB73_260348 [Klebsiella grimontii]
MAAASDNSHRCCRENVRHPAENAPSDTVYMLVNRFTCGVEHSPTQSGQTLRKIFVRQ